jgi:hypothetical protein
MSTTKDGIRTAAATLVEDVGRLAAELAALLRSDSELPPAAVAALMVEAGRVQGRLVKHMAKLNSASCPR